MSSTSPADFPYAAERDAALAFLRREAESTDGWKQFDKKSGVTYEKKRIEGDDSDIPLVRGRGKIDGITPQQFAALNGYVGCRTTWDPRTEKAEILKRFDPHNLEFYTVQKGVGFVVDPRDVVGVQLTVFHDDGKIERVLTSVVDPNVPPVNGKVRATLTISGWVIKPVDGGVDLTYVVKIHPNGSIPISIVKSVIIPEIPHAINRCADILHNKGYPPYPSSNIQSRLINEDFDYSSKTFTFSILAKGGDVFDFEYDSKMYPNGPNVEVTGEGVSAEKVDGKVKVSVSDAADGKEISFKLN